MRKAYLVPEMEEVIVVTEQIMTGSDPQIKVEDDEKVDDSYEALSKDRGFGSLWWTGIGLFPRHLY